MGYVEVVAIDGDFDVLLIGSYITTEEALSTASPNELWEKGEFEKAIALVAVQSLVVRKGGSIIGKDINNIHGMTFTMMFKFEI
jgi:hypothetical protein